MSRTVKEITIKLTEMELQNLMKGKDLIDNFCEEETIVIRVQKLNETRPPVPPLDTLCLD